MHLGLQFDKKKKTYHVLSFPLKVTVMSVRISQTLRIRTVTMRRRSSRMNGRRSSRPDGDRGQETLPQNRNNQCRHDGDPREVDCLQRRRTPIDSNRPGCGDGVMMWTDRRADEETSSCCGNRFRPLMTQPQHQRQRDGYRCWHCEDGSTERHV